MLQTHSFSIKKTARYCTLGEPTNKQLLLILHGYGQLAPRFIQKFQALENDYYIVAAEGLHRFYVEGFSGKVGASWMTKEDRLTDILDYKHYLDQLVEQIDAKAFKSVNLLGFSQGVATAFRWLTHSPLTIDRYIICSGMIPPDVHIDLNLEKLSKVQLSYITGDQDPFKKAEEVNALIADIKGNGLNLKEFTFKGGHTIHIDSIRKALERP